MLQASRASRRRYIRRHILPNQHTQRRATGQPIGLRLHHKPRHTNMQAPARHGQRDRITALQAQKIGLKLRLHHMPHCARHVQTPPRLSISIYPAHQQRIHLHRLSMQTPAGCHRRIRLGRLLPLRTVQSLVRLWHTAGQAAVLLAPVLGIAQLHAGLNRRP